MNGGVARAMSDRDSAIVTRRAARDFFVRAAVEPAG